MMTTHPLVQALVKDDYCELTRPDGQSERVGISAGVDVRSAVLQRATSVAADMGESIELVISGTLGDLRLIVTPAGEVSAADTPSSPASVVADDAIARASEMIRRGATTLAAGERVRSAQDIPAPRDTADEPMLRRRRTTFVSQTEPATTQASGWRALLRAKPSKAEGAQAEARRTVSTHWPSIRRIAVVNGKGGAGKTTATACLASVFARHGGGGVLAWDNNATRGTLGWRTEDGGHEGTIQDLLEHAGQLLQPTVTRSAIAAYVHHQTEDKYDVLRSNPELLAIRQQVNSAEFDTLVRVIDRNYRLVIFDSGNDESAERWLRMIDHSHQLVVPTTASPEAAESAMLLLEALAERDERSAYLAKNAVVVVSDGDRAGQTTPIADGFRDAGYFTEVIPLDRALRSGPIRHDRLARVTQDAWVRVAAAAARNF